LAASQSLFKAAGLVDGRRGFELNHHQRHGIIADISRTMADTPLGVGLGVPIRGEPNIAWIEIDAGRRLPHRYSIAGLSALFCPQHRWRLQKARRA
jgi:hypothetical protein